MNGKINGKKEEKYSMFKTMQTVLSNKQPSIEDINKISPFIFRRWLSNHPSGVIFANIFNIYSNVPIYSQYKLVKHGLEGKIKYIQYLKKSDEDTDGIEAIQTHYKVSIETAKEYYNILGEDKVKDLTYKYSKIKGK